MTDLKQILHRYELILTSAGEGIYGLDDEGKCTFVNPAAVAMTGWSSVDLLGESIHDKHHHTHINGLHYPKEACPIYAALKDGDVHHVTDEIFWRKDGSHFPVHYTSTPIWEHDCIVGAVVVFQDVSKLKQAESSLAQLQRHNELLLSAAGEGICGFNCEGQLTFINPAGAKLLAWPSISLSGQSIYDIFKFDEHEPEKSCPVTNIIQGKKRYTASNAVFIRLDGRYFPVDFVSTPIIEQGELQGVVIVFRDITERQKADENLHQALSEIKQLKNRLQAENNYLQEQINLNHQFEDILGDSQPLKAVLYQIEQVAPTETTVLIQGETGTGKELIARALHNLSVRKERTLVKVNCAALPSNLIESELFGHEKGSFTGAISRRIGRFELSDGGSIFLDEIGELPLELQAKLLRVLQEGEIERLGDSKIIKINVRVIAATHRDLKKMVADGEFREDLYYRLSVFPVMLPALRERKNDISLLVQCFVTKYAQKMGKKMHNIPQSVMDKLVAYSWPGNVRELENVIERAMILSPNNSLQIPELLSEQPQNKPQAEGLLSLVEMEKLYIIKVLEQTHWKISGNQSAAEILQMHPNTLRSRMNKLGIQRATTSK